MMKWLLVSSSCSALNENSLDYQAAGDLTAIVQHIRKDNPSAAMRIAEEILKTSKQLRSFPNLGRPGRLEGTRELVAAGLPFVVVYRVKQDAIEIARILHGAQQWPHPR
jgi:toxin ParE1/3/4